MGFPSVCRADVVHHRLKHALCREPCTVNRPIQMRARLVVCKPVCSGYSAFANSPGRFGRNPGCLPSFHIPPKQAKTG